MMNEPLEQDYSKNRKKKNFFLLKLAYKPSDAIIAQNIFRACFTRQQILAQRFYPRAVLYHFEN